jgi:hypothetical protein
MCGLTTIYFRIKKVVDIDEEFEVLEANEPAKAIFVNANLTGRLKIFTVEAGGILGWSDKA